MAQVNDNTESLKEKHLTYGEMKEIEAYKRVSFSNRKIAKLLGRSPQTINNAIIAGTVTQKRQQKQNGRVYTYIDEVYDAKFHHDNYLKNRTRCGRRPKWVETDEFTEWADQKMLEEKWSPDIVVEKASDIFPESIVPSTSTVYGNIEIHNIAA